ncbi:MAG: aldehyde dehydrogenase [Oligoflexia bacterium]|nr:MAG: aldehyde dehydrogenase [Oligoflexia bacterium]
MTFQTTNPATGEFLKEYNYDTLAQGQEKLHQLHKSFQNYRTFTINERSQLLLRLAKSLRNHSEELANQASLEMGKTLAEARAEVEKCAQTAEYFAENLVGFLKPDQINFGDQKNWIIKEPLGIILAIMPWNFPYWQVIRFAVPALGAGNVILMKHSDLTAGCAEKIEKVFLEASQGITLLVNSHLDHDSVQRMMGDSQIRGVTFTGSTRGGCAVGERAGVHLKKTVLELGGSDPYLVLSDADIHWAAVTCAKSRMVNNGQSCVAAKRFIVHQSVYEDFKIQFTQELKSYSYGSPFDPTSKVGSLAHHKFQTQLHLQVQSLIQNKKNHLVFGGTVPEEKGAYYPVTLIDMDSESMTQEEFFGPVALIWKVQTDEEAIQLANQSIYGLGGALFSKDIEKAKRLALELECGFVAINDMVRSDPRIPFGGVKQSGFGRELSGYGLQEFCNVKTLTLKNSSVS